MVSIDQAITGTQSGESIRHMEAIAPNTYLPRANDGDVDAPSGDEAPNSVYSLDKGLEKLNSESVNYVPEHVGGFCDNGCGGGCQDAPETVPYPKAELERVIGLLNDMKATNDALRQHVSAYSDEQKVAWYSQYRVEAEQGLNITAHDEHIDAVVAVLPKALESSHGVLKESLSTIRAYAQVARNVLAERADTQFKPVTGLLSVPLLATNPMGWVVTVGGAALSAWDIWQNVQADKKGPAELQAALDALKDIAGRNDQDVEALRKAVEDWVQRPIDTSVIVKTGLPTAKPKDDAKTKDEEPAIADPGAPVAAAPVSASPGGIGETDLGESEGGIPDDLPLGTGLTSDPMGGMPSAMPGMGGMPDMGMGSGMPGMPATDPFAANNEPPLAPVDDPFAKDDEDDDVLDPESDNPITDDEDTDAELESAEGGIPTDEDAITKDEEADGSEAPVEAEPVIQSVAATTDPAEAAVTPTSYTATLADGRQVELPTAKAAALVQSLSETPQGIRAAAADSGYTLPDDDLGIGIPVDEDAIRPGDVLMTETVKGVVIGDDELLTEEGRVVSINDAAVFSGALDGFYRLYDEDDPTTPDPVTRGESPTPIGIGAPAEGSVSGTAEPTTIAASAETTSGETAPVSTPEPGDTPSINPTQGVGEDTAPSSGTDTSDGFGQVAVGDDDSDKMTVDGSPLFDTSAQG